MCCGEKEGRRRREEGEEGWKGGLNRGGGKQEPIWKRRSQSGTVRTESGRAQSRIWKRTRAGDAENSYALEGAGERYSGWEIEGKVGRLEGWKVGSGRREMSI